MRRTFANADFGFAIENAIDSGLIIANPHSKIANHTKDSLTSPLGMITIP
jgi:hypothetical protein